MPFGVRELLFLEQSSASSRGPERVDIPGLAGKIYCCPFKLRRGVSLFAFASLFRNCDKNNRAVG